jgi:hypothetical protein
MVNQIDWEPNFASERAAKDKFPVWLTDGTRMSILAGRNKGRTGILIFPAGENGANQYRWILPSQIKNEG